MLKFTVTHFTRVLALAAYLVVGSSALVSAQHIMVERPVQSVSQQPFSVNPFLGTIIEGGYADYDSWLNYQRSQVFFAKQNGQIGGREGRAQTFNESEQTFGQNNSPRAAQFLNGLERGDVEEFTINGSGASANFLGIRTAMEEDGSIPTATVTGLQAFESVTYEGIIGDGLHGSAGTGTGDFDVYQVRLEAGESVNMTVNTPLPFSFNFPNFEDLWPAIIVYDAFGNFLAISDLSNFTVQFGLDPTLNFTAAVPGDYYFLITGLGFDNFIDPDDPFDPASGFGAQLEGEYSVDISRLGAEADYYSFTLTSGDVLGAYLVTESFQPGAAISVRNLSDDLKVGRVGDGIVSIYPSTSPMNIASDVAVNFTTTTSGRYAVKVEGVIGDYQLILYRTRPNLELNAGIKQRIFLDFNGGTYDLSAIPANFPGNIQEFVPFREYLPFWGLDNSVENTNRIIERIRRLVEENLKADIDRAGLYRNTDIEVFSNQADSPNDDGMFPGDNTSVLVVGGNPAVAQQVGINGIAQSIDPGNFDTEEIGLALCDFASGSLFTGSLNDLNIYQLAPGTTREDLVVTYLTGLITHEIGHYIGCWHTEENDLEFDLMDRVAVRNRIGIASVNEPFDLRRSAEVDFTSTAFTSVEGFLGIQDARANVAAATVFVRSGGRLIPMSEVASPLEEQAPGVDPATLLSQNFPNPATVNGMTSIGFTAETTGRVTLILQDASGRQVAQLFNGQVDANQIYQVNLHPARYNLTPGIYTYTLETATTKEVRKLILH